MSTFAYKSEYDRLWSVRNGLLRLRQPHEPGWKEIADYLAPDQYVQNLSQANRGERRDDLIINNSGSLARRTLRSGLSSGLMNPSKPWVVLTHPDPDLAESTPVKGWLHDTTRRILDALQMSNFYNRVPLVFGNMCDFGVAAMGMEEDFEHVVNCVHYQPGTYALGLDAKLKVRVFQHDMRMTVRQIVEMYGTYRQDTGVADWSTFSDYVKRAWDSSDYELEVDVCQVIEPNIHFNPKSDLSEYKRFASTHFELGAGGAARRGKYESGSGSEKFLRNKGYDLFPILCPRWEPLGNSPYGSEYPGRIAIGDVKQLQFGEEMGLKELELNVEPPMRGGSDLEQTFSSTLPGSRTLYNEKESGTKYESAYNVQSRLDLLEAKQQRVEDRINRAYYLDVITRILSDKRAQRATAMEIATGDEERFLVMGNLVTQTTLDFSDPAIEITFAALQAQGKIPPAPEELNGQPIIAKYISPLAQAQRQTTLGPQERLAQFIGGILKMNPGSADKVDFDQLIDEYAIALGVSPKSIRSDERVIEIREAQAEAQKQQQAQQSLMAGAGAAKDLSQASLEGDSALTAMLGAQGGGG